MKRYSMGLVHNPEGFMEHKMLERHRKGRMVHGVFVKEGDRD